MGVDRRDTWISFALWAAKDLGLMVMEFDSKLQVFAVYVGYMIKDSPYIYVILLCWIVFLSCVKVLVKYLVFD